MVQRIEPYIAKCLRAGAPLAAGAALLWATNALAVAPVAVDDLFSTGNGIALNDDLSTNDSGLDGPSDTYVLGSAPTNGTATVNVDGTFTYTPNPAYAGTDTFTYTITDGAGGASNAQVDVTVASATDFITAANSLLITPEDTSIPLGLSVAQDLFDGGALQDIVSTDVLFRPANGGLTPLISTIPAGVSGIVITAFSSQSNDTAGSNTTDDDYQLLNARIDLVSRVSSGRLANITNGRLTDLDQYSWSGVDLGQSVLSDPSKVVGFSTGGQSDPVFSVVGSQLRIVENHTLETAYHIEFTTAVGDSTNFLGAASAVQLVSETQSAIDIDAGVEPASGKKGIMILSGNSAAGGNYAFEYKGFSRLVIDFDTSLVSGAIAVIRGESEANTVTYGFEGYPLVDLRNGPATISDVIAGSASVIGDVTGIPQVLDSPMLYIDAAGDLVIERKQFFADNFITMYTGEAYERTGFGSIASFVNAVSDDTLFNTGGGVASDGGPINELHFEIPASAQVGLAQMSWNTVGGSDTNENMGSGFAIIDMDKGTTSGSITFVRATTPDLLSWDSVPFNTAMFGATDAAGNPLYQSNKSAGTFTDRFGENAKFSLVNLADGSRRLVFTAENGYGTETYRQYQGNMQISWLGNEPFEIQGVPVTGSLTPGSPAANGNWEIDFSELPLLTYNPLDDSSDVVDLDFTLSSSGETESIRIYIEPVVDPAVITANDSAGFVNLPFPLLIDVASSTDTDGSESGPGPLTLQGVPPSVVLSSSAGTVSNISSGIWEVSVSALATLEAQSPTTVSATVFVLGEQTDENDLDGSGVIDDNGNSVGADEFDVVNFTEVFQLTVFDIPTVVPQVTNLSSPVITGDAVLITGESLTVTVNGVSYTNGDGNLVVNANGTWTLTIPAADALVDGTYSVEAEKSLVGGVAAPDITFSELLIDLTPPPAPGVTSQTTQDSTPAISGTTHVGAGVLSVEVNGVVYTEGDGNLVNNGDGTWDLTIPPADLLADNLYQVTAQITDAAGNSAIDSGVDELLVDTTAPPSPGVTSLTTNNDTPTISGTATAGAGETLTVEVNGVIYTAGNGDLVDNGDGTWDLTIPATNVLPEATYDVTATITDLAGNSSADPSSQELTVDLTLPSTPVIISQVTGNTTPVISGLATVLAGELLTVEVDAVVYTEGDSFLINNGDGTWDLTIPAGNALADNTYNVTAAVTDAAGNSTSDGTVSELIVDLTATAAPMVVLTADANNDAFLNVTEALNPQPVDILLPAAAVAGDILLWTDTVAPSNKILTAADIAAGLVSITVALPADGALLTVTSVLVDQVGNSSPDSSDDATVDITLPVVPSVTNLITNIVVPVISGTATIGFGEILTVEVNGITYTAGDGNLLDNNDGTWDLTIPAGDALTEATYDVTATVIDLAGNASTDSSSAELIVDLTATGAPTVVLTADVNNDALLNAAEAQNPQPVEITLPAGAQVGDTLLWTDGSSPANRVLTAADIAAGLVSTSVVLPADGSQLNVLANLEDIAGNVSVNASDFAEVDLTVPGLPPVVITEDASNDGFINIAENVGLVDVSVTLPASAVAGDVLTTNIQGVVTTQVLTAADITAGTLNFTSAAPAQGALVVAEAFLTDPSGNDSSTASDTAQLDISPPVVPTVDSQVINNGTPVITGTATVDPNGILRVTVNGVIYVAGNGNLIDNGSGLWSLTIPAADALASATYDVSVEVVDSAGNATNDVTTDELIVDLTSTAAPTVILVDDANDDAFLNVAEASNPQSVSIILPAGAVVGDTLQWTDGSSPMNTILTAADITAGVVSTTVALPADGSVLTVSSVLTDQAGNTSPGNSDSATVDTTTPAVPSIVITEDTNNDAFLSLAESNGPVDVTVSLPAGVVAGDTLTVVLDGVTSTIVLTTNDVSVGAVNVTTPALASNSSIVAEAFITDIAGNVTAVVDDTVLVDISAPFIPTAQSLITNNTAPTLTGNAAVGPGDVLTVTVNGITYIEGDGNLSYNGSGSASGNGAWSLLIPATDALVDGTYDVSVSLTDPAGNTSVDITTDELVIDTVAPQAPGVTSQTTPDTTPTISGITPLAPGVTLTVEVNGVIYTEGDGNLLVNPDGTWDLTIPAADLLADGLYQVLATTTDLAGNTSIDLGIDELVVDTVLPTTPGVTSLVTNTTVPVIEGTGTVGAGETLTVTVNGITYTAGDGNLLDNGDGTWMLSIPVANALPEAVYSVTASVTDQAGNTGSDPSSDELTIDLTAPDLPAVVTQLSNLSTPTVLGTALVLPGETLTVTINGVTYVAGDGNLVDNGDETWVLNIPSIGALAEATYDVSVNVIDQAGNITQDASMNELEIDLSSTVAPIPVLIADVNDDAFLNASEAQALQPVTILLPAGAVLGDTLLWSDGITPSNTILNAGDIAAGSYQTSVALPVDGSVLTVTAVIVDLAGNASPTGTDSATVDISVPVAPTIVIAEDANDDSFLNVSELLGAVDVVINLPAGAIAGDSLVVTLDGVTTSKVLSSVDIILGAISVTTTASAQGASILAEAYLVDSAGNASSVSNDVAVVDSSVPFVPSVTSLITNDTSPTITGNAVVGSFDVLQVTVNGITYTDGDGALVNNGNGTWSLTVPATDALVDGNYDVAVSLTDLAGNNSVDQSLDELVIDTVLPQIPAVTSLTTNDQTPIISGSYTVAVGHTLRVTVNGVNYIQGDGQLSVNPDGTWDLQIPNSGILSDGLYQVVAVSTDLAGNTASDLMVDDLLVDTLLPASPGVTSLVTNSGLPTIQGTVTLLPGDVFTVSVNGVSYTLGDGNLVLNGDGTWSLTIPLSDKLPEGAYDVVAVVIDSAGNVSTDPSSTELVIDLTAPIAPTVTSQASNNPTPVINGSVDLQPGEVFTVTVNGVIYTVGDGNLVVNADGNWELSIPALDALPEGAYNVIATVADAAGNVISDTTLSELIVDISAPAAPTVNAQLSNIATPAIGGAVTLNAGDVFTVTVNGITYDGNLVVNPNGSWDLSIPASDALSEGVYEVLATVTDVAGNVTSDITADELTIDLTAPAAPTFVDVLSSSSTPTIGGQVQLEAGDSFTVTVNGVIYTVGDGFLTLDADGNWELMIDPSQPLNDGVYDVTLTFEDAAGNVVSNASGQQIVIDTGAPSLTIDDLGVVATYRPTLSGTTNAENGTIVTIRDANGEIVCEAVVSNGVWECMPSNDLVEGVNDFTAEVADSAGNIIVLNLSVTVSADFDGDGIANDLEGVGDTDADGVPDANDLDSDNDGIPDANEGAIDSDADGVPNYLDGDADNDGLADILEAEGLDGNNDYTVDNFVDEDNNGLSDELQAVPLNVVDTDFDGVPDYLDVDSDNDGVPGLRESAGEDVDNNGRIDEFVDFDSNGVDDGVQAFPLTIQDTDNDGVPNHLDLNSDNDALSDLVEAIGLDINGDSIVDAMTDADQDGIPDSVDFSVIGGSDADGDDIEDGADVDFVLGDDTDGDGIVDEFDPDANGDGYFDGFTAIANLPETDVNDIPELQEAEAEEFGELRTGRRGFGGCSIDTGSVSSRDPLLLLLTLFAFTGFIRSRRVANGISRRRSHRAFRRTIGMEKYKSSLWVACLVLCSTSLLHSDAVRADHAGNFHKRIYLGAGAGVSYLDPDDSEIPFKLEEQNDAAWGGYIGVDLGSRVSLELGYNDLGQAELQQDHFVDYQQTSLSALVYGFNRKAARERRTGLSAFGRLGVSRMQNESDIDFVRDNDFSVVIGAGAELAHESGLALRAEATSYDVDANYFGLSLLYRFGHGTHKDNLVKTSSRPLPEPAPVSAPEIVQPLVEVTPPAPAPTITEPVPSPRVEYKVLFDTNSSELNAEAIRMVEEIERQARAQSEVDIEIVGYADMRGSAEYNLWLSKQRALSVANRLIQRGIVEYRIQVEVGGEVDQFGSMSTRSGRQENRRVQVKLLGN